MRLEHRNKLIYARYKKGASQEEIGRLYGLSQSAVSKIIIACHRNIFSTSGTEDITTNKVNDVSFSADIWSVQTLVKEEFGVYYSENYIWRRMQEISCRSQKTIMNTRTSKR